jgi:hypothetical protein
METQPSPKWRHFCLHISVSSQYVQGPRFQTAHARVHTHTHTHTHTCMHTRTHATHTRLSCLVLLLRNGSHRAELNRKEERPSENGRNSENEEDRAA